VTERDRRLAECLVQLGWLSKESGVPFELLGQLPEPAIQALAEELSEWTRAIAAYAKTATAK